MQFARPTVVISRCIDFDSCRYNGQTIRASLREQLEPHIELIPICPELEIGLGVPRDPVRLVSSKGKIRMHQPATGRNVTDEMNEFSSGWLDQLGAVDGFILKAKSPSCGAGNTKVFQGESESARSIRGSGLFAGKVQEKFPDAAIEDEGRLNDLRIREHFLTKLFALAAFREAVALGTPSALTDYQARYKLLLMAYNQTRMRSMGRLAADGDPDGYHVELIAALARPPRAVSNINVLMHALGYFSDDLSAAEKAQFLDALEGYRAERLPLSAVQSVVASWLARFDVPYLAEQSYFAPYPAEMVRTEPVKKRTGQRDVFAR